MKQTLEIIKDLVISILIVACIGIILAIVFYDKIALAKVIPEVDEYVLPSEMQNELKNTDFNSTQKVIVNYYIDASDLKKYEKTNEYVKGKSNPFAEITESTNDNVDEEENPGSNQNSNNGNDSEGFYENDGSK